MTWGDGARGTCGVISATNSLIGNANSDFGDYAIDSVNNTFLAWFDREGDGGRVTVGFGDPNQLTFPRAQRASITVTPERITDTLNQGTAVTQQASNDLTINSPVTANNLAGNAGNLVLQAGRSLLLNAGVTTDNGNLMLIANETAGNGVVDSQRDAGNAAIAMAAGTELNLGTGTLTVALRDSADKTHNDRGVASLHNVTAASIVLNDGTILANGTITGPVTVNSGAVLGGGGTVSGGVSVDAGGSLSPGASGAGTLTVGGLSLSSSARFRVDINGNSAGSFDQIVVTSGAVSISGADLIAAGPIASSSGQAITILDKRSSGAITGSFNGLTEGTGVTINGILFRISYIGGDGNDIVLRPASEVVGRYLFYNNSAWDGNNAAASEQDYDAIASAPSLVGHGHAAGSNEPDKELGKQALLPSQTGSFINYSSYTKGINGIIIAWDNLANPVALSEADFVFRVGNSNTPAEWASAPAPLELAGVKQFRVEENVAHPNFPGMPDVVTIVWADENPYTRPRETGAISNQWLQVTVRANANTGLPADDVFYFGNQMGDSGNSPTDTNVDQNDEIGARNHPHTAFNSPLIADPYDFNRDKKVDQNDEILARNNPASAFTRIKLITAPSMLQASGMPVVENLVGAMLPPETLAPIVSAALLRWEATGLSADQVRTLRQTQYIVTSFSGSTLGEASTAAKTVYLDDAAAGFGWFIDWTPNRDEEFSGVKAAVGPANEQMDLLTAVMHEMGHLLGRRDVHAGADELMGDLLPAGFRRNLVKAFDAVFAQPVFASPGS